MAVWPYLHPSIKHCTDEAQKAETVLSAVSYIHIYIYRYIYYIYICFGGSGGVGEEECHAILPSSSTKLSFLFSNIYFTG